jgi:uncharacterized membrane protein YtjA (UPF0391 family)
LLFQHFVGRYGMRWLWVVFLVIALLAGALWMTSAIAASLAKIIVALFLVLFVLSLFLRGRSSIRL